jgi:hypothetical protein
MNATNDRDRSLMTADQVTDRLANEPALRAVAASCVLPIVWVEGQGVRFRRADLETWIANEHASSRRQVLKDGTDRNAEDSVT